MRGRLFIGIWVIFIIVGIIGIVPNLGFSEEVVKVGYQKIATGLPFFVALDRGFFEESGLKVEPIVFGSSNLLLEAVASGKIDASSDAGTFTFLSIEAANPGLLKIYKMALVGTGVSKGEFGRSGAESLIVRKGSDIESITQLKGKTIGIFPGIAFRKNFKIILKAYGLDIDKDVEMIDLIPPLQIGALEAGKVDALFALDPVPAICEAKGIGRRIADNLVTGYVLDPVCIGCGVFSSRFLKERPLAAKKFQEAMEKAAEWIYNNPDGAIRIFPKYIPVDEEIVLKNRCANWHFNFSKEDIALFQKNIDFWFEQGLLSKRLDVDNLLVNEKDFVNR